MTYSSHWTHLNGTTCNVIETICEKTRVLGLVLVVQQIAEMFHRFRCSWLRARWVHNMDFAGHRSSRPSHLTLVSYHSDKPVLRSDIQTRHNQKSLREDVDVFQVEFNTLVSLLFVLQRCVRCHLQTIHYAFSSLQDRCESCMGKCRCRLGDDVGPDDPWSIRSIDRWFRP